MTAEPVIVDSSAWLEFFMASNSPADSYITQALSAEVTLVVPEIVRMELLIGDPSETWADARRSFVDSLEVIALEPVADTEAAAAIHRACRRRGETVRNLLDCLIAAMAIRSDVPVLHRDRDFETMARHTTLRTISTL